MRTVRSVQGDTIDLICLRHYGSTAGITEAVLEANPGTADLGPVLPLGTIVVLPDIAPVATKETVNLWD